MSIGTTASQTPERPPITNVNRNPSAHSIGVARLITPRHSVATQENTLMPVGTAISIVVIMIGTRSHRLHAGDEHVVRPHREAEHADRDRRERQRAVAEDRLARHHGYDLADDPEPGQHHDVDGRV